MSKRKTSSEVQARIQQRYEDTALVIYRQQHVNKQSNLSRNERSPQTRQAFENLDEARELRGAPTTHSADVQSQICVII